jgi:hypothetical protein
MSTHTTKQGTTPRGLADTRRAGRQAGGPEAKPTSALDALSARVEGSTFKGPQCRTFCEFLEQHARVLMRDGTGVPYSLKGREPLSLFVEWVDAILSNTLDQQSVTIEGVEFKPGELQGASIAVGGGAGFGKTIIELNLMAYLTAVRFCPMANYLPDRDKLQEIVDLKFRPNMLDLYPWFAEMISLGKTENASGKSVHRKESYTVTNGDRKCFGHFAGMHKPPTSIHFDVCALDEVDDIDERNIGYVNGRMTNSKVRLTIFIGTQRVAGAGQNARLTASSSHVKMYRCPACQAEWNLEENFPRIVRIAKSGKPSPEDPSITPEMGHDRRAYYYCACLDCGTELDRSGGRYVARNSHRISEAKFGLRVSQLNISAISMQEFVGAWYAAFEDPSGNDLIAFYCDRVAIPNAGTAQPITQAVLDRSRSLDSYSMSLAKGDGGHARAPRFAGVDMGPRCWLWCDEVQDKVTSALVWAELIASGSLPARLPLLMVQLGIECVFLDAGGEPDLTKRMCLALNGLEDYRPPNLPRTEFLKSHIGNLGHGLTWDGEKARWLGLRAAAVLFVAAEAKGIEQTIGFTQDGKIYPLIKCNRAESIQAAVNDFLTPNEGVIELVDASGGKKTRSLPRARLPQTYIGSGAKQSVVDGHLLNLRKVKDQRTGEEDWADKVENHLGLAKVYARMACAVGAFSFGISPGAWTAESIKQVRMGSNTATGARFTPRMLRRAV